MARGSRHLLLIAVIAALSIQFVAAQNVGVFFRKDNLIAISGVPEALKQFPKTALANITVDKGTGKGVLNVENLLASISKVDTSKLTVSIDPATNTAHYEGIDATFDFLFNYTDRFGPSLRPYQGNGNGLFTLSQFSLDVTYGIDPSAGRPSYTVKLQLALTPPTFNISSGNKSVEEDLAKAFVNQTVSELTAAVLAGTDEILQKDYTDRAARYKTQFNYSYLGLTAPFDNSLVNIRSTTDGFTIGINGSIIGFIQPKSTIVDFNASRGPIQVQHSIEFFNSMLTFANSEGYFSWELDPNSLPLSDFDYRMADLYFIFPESRTLYSPEDSLYLRCSSNKSDIPALTLDAERHRIEVLQNLHCLLLHNDTRDQLASFDFTVNYILYLSVEENAFALVRIEDAIPVSSVQFTQCKFQVGDRQQSIFDTLVKEALDAYDSDNDAWGTGFRILPMGGATFEVAEKYVLIFGQPLGTSSHLGNVRRD
eukprot:TRINITY_DN4682_c0_g1_i1.p1 TRINITY_DN4682_c0_g1~~TRINITY_DN4682_c0_g1_i1.p1  ORF type:complete len:482 (+),score=143.61 TRINITY_DN4682_c0_g1_i1:172-1617(+)